MANDMFINCYYRWFWRLLKLKIYLCSSRRPQPFPPHLTRYVPNLQLPLPATYRIEKQANLAFLAWICLWLRRNSGVRGWTQPGWKVSNFYFWTVISFLIYTRIYFNHKNIGNRTPRRFQPSHPSCFLLTTAADSLTSDSQLQAGFCFCHSNPPKLFKLTSFSPTTAPQPSFDYTNLSNSRKTLFFF
jgi:hypothetical protein